MHCKGGSMHFYLSKHRGFVARERDTIIGPLYTTEHIMWRRNPDIIPIQTHNSIYSARYGAPQPFNFTFACIV